MKQENYCVIAKYPTGTVIIEAIGNKRGCLRFAEQHAKRFTRVCKMVPVAIWDKNGKRKGGASCK